MNTYFWKDGKVTILDGQAFASGVASLGLMNQYCVDMFNTTDAMRFGRFEYIGGWKHVPLIDFPKEFRLWILINLGVV